MNSIEPEASDVGTRDVDGTWIGVAMREARAMRHGYVGTEHLLLALLLEEGGGARVVLESQGLSAEPLRAELRRLPTAPTVDPSIRLPLTPRTREALEAAVDAARRTASGRLRSEHLLLAILEQEDGLARRALARFAADLDACARIASKRIADAEAIQSDDAVLLEAEIPALVAHGEELKEASTDRELPPAFVDIVFETLGRRDRCAALLVAPPASGKTMAARALAARLASDLGKKTIAIPLPELVAGTRHRGKLEERLRAIFDEAARDRRCVLFFDDLDDLTVWNEVADALDLVLSQRHAPVLATITPHGLEALESIAPSLLPKFERIAIPTPDSAAELRILSRLAPELRSHHGVEIDSAAVETALRMTKPPRIASAFRLLDAACARLRARSCLPSVAARTAFQESVRLAREADVAVAEGDVSLSREKLEQSRRTWRTGLSECRGMTLPALASQDIEAIAASLRSQDSRQETGHA